MKSGFFQGQTPEKARARLLISLIALGAVLLLIVCGVAAMLLIKDNDGGDESSQPIPAGSVITEDRPAGYISVADCGAVLRTERTTRRPSARRRPPGRGCLSRPENISSPVRWN